MTAQALSGTSGHMTTAAERFADFVHDIRLDRIPERVASTAKLVFLDTIGVALAASGSESGRMVTNFVRAMQDRGESQVIGASCRSSAPNAVLANGTLAHALDYDETLEEGIIHAGSCVVTTALAVGEACKASGKSVLEAAVAGFEVMFKIGVVAPGRFHARGFHPTALCAPFGSAAVASRLYGLSLEQTAHAFGIAGSQSSGIIEYLADGSWSKQFHAGWGAHGGIIASLLAQQGFRGPRTVFEGAHGLFAGFAGKDGVHLERLDEIGESWHLPKVVFKLYPCGSIAHPYIDCALKIRRTLGEPQASTLSVGNIERIVCRTHAGPVPRLWEPLDFKQQPPTPYAAKFSVPYCVAVALVKGRAGLDEFSLDSIRDPETIALAKKVNYEIDPSLDYPRHFTGHVKIFFKDGTIMEESQPHARGSVESPIPPDEIKRKFHQNASLMLPASKVDRIAEFIGRLEHEADIATLGPFLAP
jgi:2-methylcitrate dehydratase PrpD